MALPSPAVLAYRGGLINGTARRRSMTASVGDRIMVDSQKAGEPPRMGTILEIIEHEYGTSYRVAWDDGHESTFRPTAGTVHTTEPGTDDAE
jgi:hypothetical protein